MNDLPALRPLRDSDAADVLAAFRSAPDMARQGAVTSEDEARGYLHALRDGPHHVFAVTDDDRLVGVVAVTVDDVNHNGTFWYWLNASHRGRRWASLSATAVANWALSSGGLGRLELAHRADSPLSGNVAGAAGFVREGRERGKYLIDGQRIDALTYGRLATDPWPPSPGLEMVTA